MNLDLVAKLIDLVERSKISELELTQGESRVRIVKRANGATSVHPAAAPSDPFIEPTGGNRRNAERPHPEASVSQPRREVPATRHEIRAGFPGTFYRAAAPDQPPYAEVGTVIEDGRQLAILEAMKTMNPVEADIAGTVREITVDDGTAVEAGTLLFVIEPRA